jgi:hypothetical protein
MLRKFVLGLGLLLLAAAGFCAAAGFYPILPHLLILGLMLTAGVVWERWRYKAPAGAVSPHWTATGERFVDPGSGVLMEVYFDPRDGQRHYVEVSRK